MPPVRQTNFNGGEIAPTLYGRSDLAKHASGVRRCRNFFPSKHGALYSRSGTTYIATCPVSTAYRLIPFVFSSSQAFVLEFSNNLIRFYTNGGIILSAGVPYTLATTYAAADLALLKFAQVGDVMTLTHPSYNPRQLSRLTDTNWTIGDISFDRPSTITVPYLQEPLPTPDSTTHIARDWTWAVTEVWADAAGNHYETLPHVVTQTVSEGGNADWSAGATYAAGAVVQYQGHDWVSQIAGNLAKPPNSWAGRTAWVISDGSWNNPAGGQLNPVPASVAVYADTPVIVRLGNLAAGTLANPAFITCRIYRGRGGLFGWVGDARPDKAGNVNSPATFTDVGAEPDYSIQPPQGTNPFKVYDNAGSLIRTEKPGAVTFFEGRRWFGFTTQRPNQIWGSRVDDYSNFDAHAFALADDAVSLQLASMRLEEVHNLLGADKLLAFSSSAPWKVDAETAGDAISATGLVSARRQSSVGGSQVQPIQIDGDVLYTRSIGTGVRALAYDNLKQRYAGSDLSLLSQHLFDNHQLVDWAYAENPWSVLWVVREDGNLLSLTFSKDDQVWAWARHDTQGAVVAVCSIPEVTQNPVNAEDAVYLLVRRANGYFVERMNSRRVPEVNPLPTFGGIPLYAYDVGSIALDAMLSYAGAPATNIAGLNHLNGSVVYAIADGKVVGPLTVTANAITLPVAAASVHVGLVFTPELELLDLALGQAEVRKTEKQVTSVAFEGEMPTSGLYVGESFDRLTKWPQNMPADTQLPQVNVTGRFGYGGRACLRQVDPWPITVYAVTREVTFGGQ